MAVLVKQSVRRTLFGMAFPLLAGTVAMNAYNLVDTWYVSQLGTEPLAAMGFTFPIVMLLRCVVMGISTGTTLLVSRAMGRHDDSGAARLTTHGMVLIFCVAAVIATAGYVTIGPVFARLGAGPDTLPLIGAYMRTWYAGVLFMCLPTLGHGLLISSGDSKGASGMMIIGMVLNMILDPIMIFGLLGFPRLGIQGAALATIIAQAITSVWLVRRLHAKHNLIALGAGAFGGWFASAGRVLRLGVPSMFSWLLMPISGMVVTRILSGFGVEAVAASGAAGRLEMFAFVVPMALGISLAPFVSQNLGAGRADRIREAVGVAVRFALLFAAGVALLFFIGAPLLASIFSEDPKVLEVLTAYLRIVCFGYGLMEVHRYVSVILTGLHKPVHSAMINAVRVLGLLVPLSLLGAHLFDVRGVFFGRLVTDLLSGGIAMVWIWRACRNIATDEAAPPTPRPGAVAAEAAAEVDLAGE